jgi:hypothetical protein
MPFIPKFLNLGMDDMDYKCMGMTALAYRLIALTHQVEYILRVTGLISPKTLFVS